MGVNSTDPLEKRRTRVERCAMPVICSVSRCQMKLSLQSRRMKQQMIKIHPYTDQEVN